MKQFDPKQLKRLKKPSGEGKNGQARLPDGQVTIIGGSDLFHGAPILALKVASRIVDMVYFSSPEPSVGRVAEELKSQLGSFIWVPWDEVEAYIEKSDAVLIGPGMKRWRKENSKFKIQNSKLDEVGRKTKEITESFLSKFPKKCWVIDAGALQVMEAKLIPKNSILTPNAKEYQMLFAGQQIGEAAKKYNCIIVLKGKTTTVCSPKECIAVTGGNPGLAKGGTGDVQAGLTVALAARNEPFLAASAAAYIVKAAADSLRQRVGLIFNADDLAEEIPRVLGKYLA